MPQALLFLESLQIREQKVKCLTPREAGYAIQLSDKTLLDVRPSVERNKASACLLNFFLPISLLSPENNSALGEFNASW